MMCSDVWQVNCKYMSLPPKSISSLKIRIHTSNLSHCKSKKQFQILLRDRNVGLENQSRFYLWFI